MNQKRKKFPHIGFLIFLVLFFPSAQAAPMLRIVGSSAVFPFAATVAEHFHYKTHAPTPLVEAIGTGAGIKLFCAGVSGPDGVMTSRPFSKNEKEKCNIKGVTFEEFKIGQDGLVLIQNKRETPFSVTLVDLNKALAEKIPQGNECIKNPYKTWNEVQQDFPTTSIRVLGPAPTSGTYDVLVEKILGECSPYLRHDGAYIEAPANENLIVQKVLNTPYTIGIVTFSFYEQNRARLEALPLNGILPSFESIRTGKYRLSRPLYLYVKTNDISHHAMRSAYVLEFTSEAAIGEKGYLKEKGLIPLNSEEVARMHHRALDLQQGNDL